MAVDSAQKRRSAISFGDLSFAERVPQATNLDTAAERIQEAFSYGGIAPSASSSSGAADSFSRRRTATFIKRNADFVNRRGS